MWCPECKAEYINGITQCPECGLELVAELPEEPDEPLESIAWVELMYTHNQGHIAIIKSLLDEAGIIYYFQGDIVSTSRPWVDPARLYIKREDIDQAKILLDDFL